MTTAVVMINFGEPSEPTLEQVVPFLERIFFQNAPLEGGDEETRRRRSRELAEARAPGLIEEYGEIGGSPLNAQSDAQADAVAALLAERGHDVRVYSAFQYTEPFVEAAVNDARERGCTRLLALPVYPLCGHSTTILALDEVRSAVEAAEWDVEVHEVSGWHRHPDFFPMWADHIEVYSDSEGVDLQDPDTALLFSIHGTPVKYLEAGNRYDRYVDEACTEVATRLGVSEYHIGYQNHTNRPIDWTQPDVEKTVEKLGDTHRRVVVAPLAFLHEQSETLAELDDELREAAQGVGLDFHRVPIPHDDPRLTSLLADIAESRIGDASHGIEWRRCVCRGRNGLARCTNGLRFYGSVQI